MTLLRTLVRIETIKALRRFGFWLTVAALGGVLVIVFGSEYYGALRTGNPPPRLPDAWEAVAAGLGPVAAIFGSVALILLVAAEFSWKTARQNVIDGLSKDQFFLGKLLLVPGLAVAVCGVQLGLGGAAGLAGSLHLGGVEWPLFRVVDLGIFAGFFLQALGFLSLAFLAAMIARSAGGAMGIFLLYAAVLEPLLGQALRPRGGWLEALADLLPIGAFSGVNRVIVWDPEALAAAVEQASAQGRPRPEVLAAPAAVAVTLAWVAVLALLAYVAYRRRDL